MIDSKSIYVDYAIAPIWHILRNIVSFLKETTFCCIVFKKHLIFVDYALRKSSKNLKFKIEKF